MGVLESVKENAHQARSTSEAFQKKKYEKRKKIEK